MFKYRPRFHRRPTQGQAVFLAKSTLFLIGIAVSFAGTVIAYPALRSWIGNPAHEFELPPLSRYLWEPAETLAIRHLGSTRWVLRATGFAAPTPFQVTKIETGSTNSFSNAFHPTYGKAEFNSEEAAWAKTIAEKYQIAPYAAEQIVEKAAAAGKRHKVDPALILAIIATESRFNPFAASNVGAIGLSQVLPKYHPEKLDVDNAEAILINMHSNIDIGAEILSEYLTWYNGNTVKALQQYNGALRDPHQRYSQRVFNHYKTITGKTRPALLVASHNNVKRG